MAVLEPEVKQNIVEKSSNTNVGKTTRGKRGNNTKTSKTKDFIDQPAIEPTKIVGKHWMSSVQNSCKLL